MKRLTRILAPVLLTAGLLGGSVAVASPAAARPEIEEPDYVGPTGPGAQSSGWEWFDRSCFRVWPWEKCPAAKGRW